MACFQSHPHEETHSQSPVFWPRHITLSTCQTLQTHWQRVVRAVASWRDGVVFTSAGSNETKQQTNKPLRLLCFTLYVHWSCCDIHSSVVHLAFFFSSGRRTENVSDYFRCLQTLLNTPTSLWWTGEGWFTSIHVLKVKQPKCTLQFGNIIIRPTLSSFATSKLLEMKNECELNDC